MSFRRIVLEISDEDFAFAEHMAAQDGFIDAADCLQGVVKTALLHARSPREDDARDALIRRLRTEKLVLQETIISMAMQAGERSLPLCDGACAAGAGGDVDDEIPF